MSSYWCGWLNGYHIKNGINNLCKKKKKNLARDSLYLLYTNSLHKVINLLLPVSISWLKDRKPLKPVAFYFEMRWAQPKNFLYSEKSSERELF